ncbi:hypothetical protein LCGC14_3097830, partial [marine sediment metagenome]
MIIDWKKIKKYIKPIIFVISLIVSIILINKIRRAIVGKVEKPIAFIADVNDDTIIH